MKRHKMLFGIGVIAAMILAIGGFLIPSWIEAGEKNNNLRIGSTTSLQDSGLWDKLMPMFEEETGIKAQVIAVGTGQALQLGRDGEVDVLVIHDKHREEVFVEEGHGIKRYQVMENDFILVGPSSEELSLQSSADKTIDNDILACLEEIAVKNLPFISRGDDSGTHQLEKNLWQQLAINPTFSQYQSAGTGMGAVLQMADEGQAFTITDRATYNKRKENLELNIICEGDPLLKNLYGAIMVNPDKNKQMNQKGAEVFIAWLLSKKVQDLIGSYGLDDQGRPMFMPSYEVYP